MAYVTVPKDLTKVKSKVMFGLTKRQLICFGTAVLIGVPLFFLLQRTAGSSTATFCMIVVMLPLFLLAMYERHGQPLAKKLDCTALAHIIGVIKKLNDSTLDFVWN